MQCDFSFGNNFDIIFRKIKNKTMHKHSSNAVYGLGLIGAAVFYIKNAATFGAGVLGFLKALVWPAMLVYKLLDFLY